MGRRRRFFVCNSPSALPPVAHSTRGARQGRSHHKHPTGRVSHGANSLAPGSLARRRLARLIHHHHNKHPTAGAFADRPEPPFPAAVATPERVSSSPDLLSVRLPCLSRTLARSGLLVALRQMRANRGSGSGVGCALNASADGPPRAEANENILNGLVDDALDRTERHLSHHRTTTLRRPGNGAG